MKFTKQYKFEFTKDINLRQIKLVTHTELTVLQFPMDYPLHKFGQTYDFFLDFSVSKLHKTMCSIASSIPGSCVYSELKPGLIYDSRHQPTFFMNRAGKQVNRDRWSDGLTWDEWCSSEQIAKEYYGRKKHWESKQKNFQDEDEDERPILDDDWKAPVRPERKFTKKEDDNLGDMLDGLLG